MSADKGSYYEALWQHFTNELDAVRQEVARASAQLEHQQEARESERRQVTSTSVKLEAWGTGFFLLGVLCTGIAAVTC